ncbi:MAG TPA: SPFH domain-containing protein [Phycisphaerae bacterium]|nr:SPFH domain-containing protein [Phycisphaerae bacterium]
MRKLVIAIITVAVVLMLFLELCTFVQKPYEKVILDRFGQIVTNPPCIAYNWYLCWPTDRVIRMDMRLHLYQSDSREINTLDKEPISIRAFALWKIIDPVSFYNHLPYGPDETNQFLDTRIQSSLVQVLGQYDTDQIFNTDVSQIQMTQAEDQIQDLINQGTPQNPGMEALGVQVIAVGFARLTFPPSVAMAVYSRMSAEREGKATQYVSEGQAQAQTITAQAKQQAASTTAAADQKAAEIRGQGDATAYQIINDVQTTPQAREFYRFWKSLTLFQNSMGRGTYWVLTPDNPVTAPLFEQMEIYNKSLMTNDAAPATQPAGN